MNPRHPLPVLVVEDDDVDREALLRRLSSSGLHLDIETASDGLEALQHLRRADDATVVLLDWRLPGMTGDEFLAAVRADPDLHRTEVFILSGSDHPEHIHSAFSHQVAGYVVKQHSGAGEQRLIEMLTAYADATMPLTYG